MKAVLIVIDNEKDECKSFQNILHFMDDYSSLKF